MVDTNGQIPGAGTLECAECGAPLAADQRYCLTCGTRHAALPADVAALLATARDPEAGGARRLTVPSAPSDSAGAPAGGAPGEAAPAAGAPGVEAVGGVASPWAWTGAVPAPRTLGIAVLATMAFGIVAGSYNNPTFDNLASAPLLLLVTGHPTQPAAPAPVATPSSTALAATPADTGAGSDGGVQTITETIGSAAPATPAAPLAGSASLGSGVAPQTVDTNPPATPNDSGGGSGNLLNLPPVKHVFLIVLSGQGYSQTFSPTSTDTYLSRTLPKQGELLSNYYGVAGSSLANGIALISGQGPTQETLADCPTFTEISPWKSAKLGQVVGHGCGYPAAVGTLPGQLIANGFTPKAYIDGLETAADPGPCHRPPTGTPDPASTPDAAHHYVSRHNPFAYFDGLAASVGCGGTDQAPLSQLGKDLGSLPTTPSLSYIVPSPCEDGSANPCQPGAPAGLTPADAFLKRVIPEIERSDAYKADGLIAVTFDEAPQSGPGADTSACCSTPAYPNVPAGSSGGESTTSTSSTTGATTTTGTTTTGATTATGATTTGTTTTTGATTTTGTTTTATGTDTTGTTTSTTTPSDANGGQTTPTGGGGQVGLLLLSRYVTPGSSDLFDYFNHYSLLATIENLFSLPRLGYASDPALPMFDAHIFNRS